MKKKITTLLLFFTTCSFAQPADSFSGLVKPAVFSLSKVMMHDVVNPPAASRYYAYCLLGAYTLVSNKNSSLPPIGLLIKDFPRPAATIDSYHPEAAALYCILETGRLMLPSGYLLEEELNQLKAALKKKKIPAATIEKSASVARAMALQVVQFSKADAYNKLSAKLRYTPLKGEGYWYPTPPAYIEAVEPNWKTVRPMIIDSCNQFIPVPPVPYSNDTTSAFHKLAKEVYDFTNTATPEEVEMANFWDCNPFAVSTSGHLSLGFKKISPGGHWMNIGGIAAEKARLNFRENILMQTLLSLTLMDAFISCWDEKYRSHRIRPETYINRYIDKMWQPLLQTPPFPEYPSGHSVVSTASAELLSYFLGDNFSFTDDSEVIFDIPERKFQSFRAAAEEAAISRLYGGIHFRDAIVNGQEEGRLLAKKIISKLQDVGVQPFRLAAK